MKRIALVVDDSPTLVKFVSFSLKTAGFDIISASDGMDAIEKIARSGSAVDIVITDLNMPNVDGYELIATLRQNRKFDSVPIVILSSEDGEADKAKGLAAGANAYLIKPFQAQQLLKEVERLLANSKMQLVRSR